MPPVAPQDVAPQAIIVVSCTHPPAGAEALAHALVSSRLAACVQLTPGIRSVYRWDGRVEVGEETRLDIKTTAARLPALIAEIERLHPHDVPEVLALPVAGGSEPYLDWIRKEV
jgi:periplasmic divalent cation tolerance protein